MAGGHKGLVVGNRPKRYKTTPQQLRFREAAEHCGIKKGMGRSELIVAMKECLPKFFSGQKGQDETPAPDHLVEG